MSPTHFLVTHASGRIFLNAGCGHHCLPDWVNLDFVGHGDVQGYDLRKGIPFPDNTFDLVYSSHMLEHLSRDEGMHFLSEAYRVLKPGGIVRILTPDLERMVQEYLKNLEGYSRSDTTENRQRYDWILLEMFDQMTREKSGGMMAEAIQRKDVCREYVLERTGDELRGWIDAPPSPAPRKNPSLIRRVARRLWAFAERLCGRKTPTAKENGELHRWYYDRVSLARACEHLGFVAFAVVDFKTSAVAGWDSMNLDISRSGLGARKPDSITIEARKPEQKKMSEQTLRGKKVLLTGGLGFIGSHLARRLVTLGAEVTIVDSLNPMYGGNLANIRGIEKNIQVNISDVRDPHSMQYLIQGKDLLFNLAGQTSHMDSMQDPFTDLDINAVSQLHILEACRKFNAGIRIVFASTRQLYGKPEYLPVDEKHPVRPVDVNGINKWAGEGYHLLYQQVYGIPTTVLRLTNTIGTCMRIKDARQTFLGVWIRCLLENKPFEVWGSEPLRDFTDVEDAVDAFILAATHEKAVGQTYNVGGCAPVTLKQLADTLVSVAGYGNYTLKDFPADRKKIDIGSFYSDYRKMTAELGWTPKVSLEESLRKIIPYYTADRALYL